MLTAVHKVIFHCGSILIKTLLLAALCVGCSFFTKDEIDGVRIGNTLYEQQDYETNKRFCTLITEALQRDSRALADLLAFECGGAAGCYDLGSVVTQIVFKVGEKDIVRMSKNFSLQQKTDLRELLKVGLEYGWPLIKNVANGSLEQQFPLLSRYLL